MSRVTFSQIAATSYGEPPKILLVALDTEGRIWKLAPGLDEKFQWVRVEPPVIVDTPTELPNNRFEMPKTLKDA